MSEQEHEDPTFEVTPRYWIQKKEVEARVRAAGWEQDWLLTWRDVSSAKLERTVVPALIPMFGAGHTLLLMYPSLDVTRTACLLANLSSLVLDYCARQKLSGTHLTHPYMKQFPVIPPTQYDEEDRNFIIPRVLELAYTTYEMRPFANSLGYSGPPFSWLPDRRALIQAELDAYFARLYGLTEDELRYVLQPSSVFGPTYPSETFCVLKEREVSEYGEFCTERLVLESWKRLHVGTVEAAAG